MKISRSLLEYVVMRVGVYHGASVHNDADMPSSAPRFSRELSHEKDSLQFFLLSFRQAQNML